MKLEDFKVGMKVKIPKTKNTNPQWSTHEEFMSEMNRIGNGVDYLIIKSDTFKDGEVELGFEDNRNLFYNLFSINDLEPYEGTKSISPTKQEIRSQIEELLCKLYDIEKEEGEPIYLNLKTYKFAIQFDIRSRGNLTNKGFYLTSDYNWEIIRDDLGENVLVPKLKD